MAPTMIAMNPGFWYQNFESSWTFGVSEYNGSVDIETSIKLADNALYRGKKNGRNLVTLANSDQPGSEE